MTTASALRLSPELAARFAVLVQDLLSWDARRPADAPVVVTAAGVRISFPTALHDLAIDEAVQVAALLDERASVPGGVMQRMAREIALAACLHAATRLQQSRRAA